MTEMACRSCGFMDSGVFCSACGAELTSGTAMRGALRAMFRPLFEYFEYAMEVAFPRRMANRIKADEFHLPKFTAFLTGSVAISSVSEAVFPDANAVEKVLEEAAPAVTHFVTAFPLLADALTAVIIMPLAALVTSLSHYFLNRGNRDVSIKKYWIAIVSTTALFYPVNALASGMTENMNFPIPAFIISLVSFVFMVRMFSVLYSRGWISTVFGLVLGAGVFYLGAAALLFGVLAVTTLAGV